MVLNFPFFCFSSSASRVFHSEYNSRQTRVYQELEGWISKIKNRLIITIIIIFIPFFNCNFANYNSPPNQQLIEYQARASHDMYSQASVTQSGVHVTDAPTVDSGQVVGTNDSNQTNLDTNVHVKQVNYNTSPSFCVGRQSLAPPDQRLQTRLESASDNRIKKKIKGNRTQRGVQIQSGM